MRSQPATRGTSATIARFAALGALSSLATIAASIVRSKVAASRIGPSGVGVFAEVTQLLAVTSALASIASGPSLVTRASIAHAEGRGEDVDKALGSSITLGVVLSLLGVAAAMASYPFVLPARSENLGHWVFVAGLATTFMSLGQSFASACTAVGWPQGLAAQSLVTAVLGSALQVACILVWGLDGQFRGYLALGIVNVAVGFATARVHGIRPRLGQLGSYTSDALRLGLTNLVAVAFMQLTMSSARIALEKAGGLDRGADFNGQFQAAHAVGAQYFSLVLSSLGTYFFPRYAAADSREALEAEVRSASDFVLRFGAPLLLLLLAVRQPLIRLLYSHRFDPASQVLGLTLAGDLTKGLGWAFAGPLLYRGDVTGFLVTEGLIAAFAVAANVVLVGRLGLDGIGAAYLLTHAVYAILAAVVLQRRHGIGVRTRELAMCIGASGVAAGLALSARRWPFVDLAILGGAIVWAVRSGAIRTMGTGLASRWERLRQRYRRPGG